MPARYVVETGATTKSSRSSTASPADAVKKAIAEATTPRPTGTVVVRRGTEVTETASEAVETERREREAEVTKTTATRNTVKRKPKEEPHADHESVGDTGPHPKATASRLLSFVTAFLLITAAHLLFFSNGKAVGYSGELETWSTDAIGATFKDSTWPTIVIAAIAIAIGFGLRKWRYPIGKITILLTVIVLVATCLVPGDSTGWLFESLTRNFWLILAIGALASAFVFIPPFVAGISKDCSFLGLPAEEKPSPEK